MKGPLAAIWEIPKPLSVHPIQVDDDTVITSATPREPRGPQAGSEPRQWPRRRPLLSVLVSAQPRFRLACPRPEESRLEQDRRPKGPQASIPLHATTTAFLRRLAVSMARNRPLASFTPFQPLQAFTHLRGETTTPLWCFSLRPSATPAPGTGSSSRGPRAQPTCSGGGHSGSDPGKTLRNFIPICPISTGPFRESSNSWRERPSRSRRPAKAYELRCPSEFEAQIWDHASKYAVSVDFGALRCPVKIVSSDPTSQKSGCPDVRLRGRGRRP